MSQSTVIDRDQWTIENLDKIKKSTLSWGATYISALLHPGNYPHLSLDVLRADPEIGEACYINQAGDESFFFLRSQEYRFAPIDIPLVKREPVKLPKAAPKILNDNDTVEVGIYVNNKDPYLGKPWFRDGKGRTAYIARPAIVINGLAFIHGYRLNSGDIKDCSGADIIHVPTGMGILATNGGAMLSRAQVWKVFCSLVNEDLAWDRVKRNSDRLIFEYMKDVIRQSIDEVASASRVQEAKDRASSRQKILNQVAWQQDEWGWRATVVIDGVLYDTPAYFMQIKTVEPELVRSIVNDRRRFIKITENHFRLPANL